MALYQEVYGAGQEIASAAGVDLSESLCSVLDRFLSMPFGVASRRVVDLEGNSTDTFACVISAKPEDDCTQYLESTPADATAAVIDACENIDIEGFRAAYRRIAEVKRLKKSAVPIFQETPRTTVTLGIIFALRSDMPLEDLAEELCRLNGETPSREWPDMVVVMSTGVINYTVQFPGESLLGDYLPPAENALTVFIPPTYIVVAARPTIDFTFNKMVSFLIAHLAIFCPEAKLINWAQILEGDPQKVLTISGFQYNLKGDLVPVPRQFYNDRYLPPLPMRIEDQGGELLCTLQFLPWQDGGVILLRGKLPLDGLLIFLGKEVFERVQVFKRPNLQISSVLPITQQHFYTMLDTFQQRSNMIVRPDQTNWVIQKLADEGSQSPFMARLFMGILRLRDEVYPDHAERENFDKSYEVVTSNLMNARTAAGEIAQLLREHIRKVTLGEVARVENRTIRINESIDKELRKEVESFLNAAVRTLKQGMQNLTKELHVNIGFLFMKQTAFDNGIAFLETTDSLLANYLRETRVWSERLIDCRNAVEHNSWVLPRVSYSHSGNKINVSEPSISGQLVSEFAEYILDRLCCFVEEVTAHCLQRRLPPGITITEIPLSQRLREAPKRFTMTLAYGGQPTWKMVYHTSTFDIS